ncbi:MAG: hypothetical protein AB7F09_06650 [Parvibaculaceae bacterium]
MKTSEKISPHADDDEASDLGTGRMGRFYRSQLGLTIPLVSGNFIHLAREIDARLIEMQHSGAPEGSTEKLRLAGEVYARRKALCESQPITDLDALIVTLMARQGLEVLRDLPLDDEHKPHRSYWFDEVASALNGVQALLEVVAGFSLEELGFTLKGGTPIN